MSLINGIHHVALKCATPEEFNNEITFYRDVLEIPVIRRWPTGIMLNTSAGIIEIFNDADSQLEQGVIRHFAFVTDDVDACVSKVRAAGYEITVEPKDIVINSDPKFPARIAFCKGPIGEEIEFFCEK